MDLLFDANLSAIFQTSAAVRAKENWRGFWRVKKRGSDWQLRHVQMKGKDIELTGPVIANNMGKIEIGDNSVGAANSGVTTSLPIDVLAAEKPSQSDPSDRPCPVHPEQRITWIRQA